MRTKKAKLIHLSEEVFKTLAKDAIEKDMSMKALIEGILKRYSDYVNKTGDYVREPEIV